MKLGYELGYECKIDVKVNNKKEQKNSVQQWLHSAQTAAIVSMKAAVAAVAATD